MNEEHGQKADADNERAESKPEDEQDVRCQEARQVELACWAPSDAAVADQANGQGKQGRDDIELILEGRSYSIRQGGQASGFAEAPPRFVPTRRLVAVQRLTVATPLKRQRKRRPEDCLVVAENGRVVARVEHDTERRIKLRLWIGRILAGVQPHYEEEDLEEQDLRKHRVGSGCHPRRIGLALGVDH